MIYCEREDRHTDDEGQSERYRPVDRHEELAVHTYAVNPFEGPEVDSGPSIRAGYGWICADPVSDVDHPGGASVKPISYPV